MSKFSVSYFAPGWLPPSVRNALEVWNSNAGLGSTPLTFPAAGAWRNPSPNAVGCPQEAYLEDVLFAHIKLVKMLLLVEFWSIAYRVVFADRVIVDLL